MGFSRQEYWNGLPFPSPGHLPNPGIKPESPALAGGFFTTEPPGKPSSAFIDPQFQKVLKIWKCISFPFPEPVGTSENKAATAGPVVPGVLSMGGGDADEGTERERRSWNSIQPDTKAKALLHSHPQRFRLEPSVSRSDGRVGLHPSRGPPLLKHIHVTNTCQVHSVWKFWAPAVLRA